MSDPININSFEKLGETINEENIMDISECLFGALHYFLELKKKDSTLRFTGINWTDDKENKIAGLNVTLRDKDEKKAKH